MTPSERLDDILARGLTPVISEVVDLDEYKYVWRNHGGIQIGNWYIPIPYGMMSDGDSGVPDLLPEGFFAHDRLYASPFATFKNVRKQVSKRTCDLLYTRIGLKRFNIRVALRGLFLSTGINNSIWKKKRKQDHEKLLKEKTVPKAMCWEFPTQYVKHARWVGLK